MSEMNKKGKVDWSKIDGSSPKPKRLRLEKDETDSLYHCPIQVCDHDGFKSQRGCRKHVNTKPSWFFFFDEKPDQGGLVASTKELVDVDKSSEIAKPPCRVLPSFSVSSPIGESFTKWLTGSGGGCKKDRAAQQIVKRCFKFLKLCCNGTAVASIHFNEVVVDPNWTYDLAIWIGKNVDYSSHVL